MKRPLAIVAALALLVALIPITANAIYNCDNEAVMRWYPGLDWVCVSSTSGGEACVLCWDSIDVPYTP